MNITKYFIFIYVLLNLQKTFAILDFEVRNLHRNSIIVQEMIEAESDDYVVNKFMREFADRHLPEDHHSIVERLTIAKKGDSYCSYFFENNHVEHFGDNLGKTYHKKYVKHHYFAYFKIHVPRNIDLNGCFEIFKHKFGSAFILSNMEDKEKAVHINNFIKRYHVYETIKTIDTSNYIPYYISFLILIGMFGINLYFKKVRQQQLRTMMKILKWIKKRNEFPNNL